MTKTHRLIEQKLADGYDIIYIGKKGHPEPEGAVGINPERIHLVETIDDVERLSIHNERIMVTNQTTMSQWDVADIMAKVKENTRTWKCIKKFAWPPSFDKRRSLSRRRKPM
ncbi:hypothetical protein DI43_12670 [Geobacillus sp. CAMR12739]|nr:hypothetical protein DI43_12670 [Geobacillus sp. CAMR12739]